jgi:hypothetical protein
MEWPADQVERCQVHRPVLALRPQQPAVGGQRFFLPEHRVSAQKDDDDVNPWMKISLRSCNKRGDRGRSVNNGCAHATGTEKTTAT